MDVKFVILTAAGGGPLLINPTDISAMRQASVELGDPKTAKTFLVVDTQDYKVRENIDDILALIKAL